MRVFTVHDPAPSARPAPPRLVPEGFSWWAFLLGPLWLLAKRLWLPLLGWLVLAAATGLLAPAPWGMAAGLALALLTGWHGRDAERWALERRGLPVSGVVLGRDEEEAILRLGATPR